MIKENSVYSQLLRSPKWQRKRLEIMKRDEYTCQSCFDKESTLNVHHKYYEKNKNPWEYKDEAYITLCESCHSKEKNLYQSMMRLCFALADNGFNKNSFDQLSKVIEENGFCQIGDVMATFLVWVLGEKQNLLIEQYFSDLRKKVSLK